jgi:hypothetical protein
MHILSQVYRLISSGTVEERLLERAEKKLLLEMVNRESSKKSDTTEDKGGGLSAKDLLADIKFGCQAVFGDSANNELPSLEDIETITDRSRKESDSVGKLHGGVSKNAASFDAKQEFSQSQMFEGADFQAIRQNHEKEKAANVPKNLKGIGHLWEEVSQLSKKRAGKSRIIFIDGNGSGYGSAAVPVLASNNYELSHGESSVFDRELSHSKKERFQVPAKKKKNLRGTFENQDHCQVSACLLECV